MFRFINVIDNIKYLSQLPVIKLYYNLYSLYALIKEGELNEVGSKIDLLFFLILRESFFFFFKRSLFYFL